jgi:hypothetical protein
MFGDFPTQGWRYRAFLAGVTLLGLAGLSMLFLLRSL